MKLVTAWARCGFVAVLALTHASAALADEPAEVQLSADGVFGSASMSLGAPTLIVRAQNTSTADLHGVLEVRTSGYGAEDSPRQIIALDLPANETRFTTVTLPGSDEPFQSALLSYRVGGRELRSGSVALGYSANTTGLLALLDDPPRLRGPLTGMTRLIDTPYGGSETAEVLIGTTTTEPRSGQLILPRTVAGWSSALLVVSSVSTLERVEPDALQALERWIEVGGHLVLMPTREQDLHHPLLTRVFPGLARGATRSELAQIRGDETLALACPDDAAREPMGCVRRVGFGWVRVVDGDLQDPSVVNDAAVRSRFEAIARSAAPNLDPIRPLFPPGPVSPSPSYPWVSNAAGPRQALDPNEGYAPFVVLSAFVLLIYVVLVGPVNFFLVKKSNTPVLALITTPALALLTTGLVFALGFAAKGVLMRYRRVEIDDLASGSSIARARRYTGFFFTRPSSFELEVAPDTVPSIDGEAGRPRRAEILLGADRTVIDHVRASLWETVVVREDATPDLGGAVTLELRAPYIVRVQNATRLTLHSAFVVDPSGPVHVIGELAPGASAEVPTETSAVLPPTLGPVIGSTDDPFCSLLGFSVADSSAVLAAMRIADPDALAARVPVLYARLDPDAEPTARPSFRRERDSRVLRVVPRLPPPIATESPVAAPALAPSFTPPTLPPGLSPEPAESDPLAPSPSPGEAP